MSKDGVRDKMKRLHKTDLSSSGAPAAIGLLVSRQLLEYGQSTVYLDDEGFVSIAAPGETSLDSLPEEMAINTLLEQGWNEDEVANYLRGRDARLKRG